MIPEALAREGLGEIGGDPGRFKRSREISGPSGQSREKRHFRAIFISDIHLGTRGCNAELLLDFLKHTSSDYLYLVGDIIDGWRLKKAWYWHPTHNDVIRKVLKKARKGTQVIYIPGNHDEVLRDFVGNNLAGVEIARDAVHVTADGRRYWVLHGDEFDGIVRHAKWLAHLGDHAYNLLMKINNGLNIARRRLGYSYWSLSAFLKYKVKNAVEYISSFETAVAHEAARRGVDGVICGHIHHAEERMIGDIHYCNDGDWVESGTALVEHTDGRFEILFWADMVRANEEPAQLTFLEAAE
ncbi:MAG: UDP-2,3-diacylglucosamine diphosphatase [Sphingomonadales bacterium]|nr:UDP-2,3-diacylglucosamine diphosphatase [Sphingomonadales bacterium]